MSDARFVLMKRGQFWRPEGCGYTTDLLKAGVYDQAEADKHDAHAREFPEEPTTSKPLHVAVREYVGRGLTREVLEFVLAYVGMPRSEASTLNRMWQDEKHRALAAEQEAARLRAALEECRAFIGRLPPSLVSDLVMNDARAALSPPAQGERETEGANQYIASLKAVIVRNHKRSLRVVKALEKATQMLHNGRGCDPKTCHWHGPWREAFDDAAPAQGEGKTRIVKNVTRGEPLKFDPNPDYVGGPWCNMAEHGSLDCDETCPGRPRATQPEEACKPPHCTNWNPCPVHAKPSTEEGGE